MDDEKLQAKRERDRRASQAYRARKREARRESARVAADGAPGEMRQSVDAALSAMKWLVDSDAATVAQARATATLIDAAMAQGDHSVALRGHGQLTRLLDALGGTPRVRMQLELRSRKIDITECDAAPSRAGNVSRFVRPAKRR
ncbi:hypothetical protein AUC47_10275 [Microbacterium sp. SZ1]|uniref:terminase small subunit n=1 Tax=Microbacterium sp. SZ1 TaxID=1849736 RepID=UPI000BBCBF37|nr:hypothetical protein [Microbacterium sp. SZ1]PCE15903.1 hypothetical protein AUC47_10275 [Microbacterium sp. SZ1]